MYLKPKSHQNIRLLKHANTTALTKINFMASLLSLNHPKLISPIKATSTSTTTTTSPQSPPQTLEQKFGRKGIKFIENGNVQCVELSVRNGSTLNLRINDGLITSYKPRVYWKDEPFEEVLYTVQSNESEVKGGIGLILNDELKISKTGATWAALNWAVTDSDSDSIDAVQVELSCTNGDGSLDVTYIISLYPLSMAAAVIVKNTGRKPAKLRGGILSHMKFKNRKSSALQGLIGCPYTAHPHLNSNFSLISANEAMTTESTGWFGSDEEVKKGEWIEEDNMYTLLEKKFSRIYAAPPSERLKRIYNTSPSKYETIDRGTKLGFRVIRMGYEDIYICSPGSLSKKYGNDYFICTGPGSILVPVDLKPGEEWRGAQVIEHDNL